MANTLKKQIFGLIVASLLAAGFSRAQQQPTRQTTAADRGEESVLIVYLSRTRNTETVARMIQEATGGRMVAVELEKPYPQDYKAIVEQVDRENKTGFLPPIKTKIKEIDRYQTIFVGFPTWDMTLPPPMKSFLASHNLAGKTVVPFNTNGGYGVGSGFQKVKELCAKSTVLKGFSTTGGLERDGIPFVMEGEKAQETREQIADWLRTIGVPTSR